MHPVTASLNYSSYNTAIITRQLRKRPKEVTTITIERDGDTEKITIANLLIAFLA